MRIPGRVTIGIPTFNRRNILMRAVRSSLSQTYDNVEVLVSDDASTDGTFEELSTIKDQRLVVYRQEKNLGMVGNFDFCLRNATGEFFLLLGSDDVLFPTAIERLVQPFKTAPKGLPSESIGLVWCTCRIAGIDGDQFWITEGGPEIESPADWLAGLWKGNRGPRFSGILLRTEDALAVGGYQTRYGDVCDIANYGPAALRRDYVVCVHDPVVQYTNHSGSCTGNSVVKKWQEWMELVHQDVVARAQARGNKEWERTLRKARTDCLSSITLTCIVQMIGRPGWLRDCIYEAFRRPGPFLTGYMLRRLWKDGWKVVRVPRTPKHVEQKASGVA